MERRDGAGSALGALGLRAATSATLRGLLLHKARVFKRLELCQLAHQLELSQDELARLARAVQIRGEDGGGNRGAVLLSLELLAGGVNQESKCIVIGLWRWLELLRWVRLAQIEIPRRLLAGGSLQKARTRSLDGSFVVAVVLEQP